MALTVCLCGAVLLALLLTVTLRPAACHAVEPHTLLTETETVGEVREASPAANETESRIETLTQLIEGLAVRKEELAELRTQLENAATEVERKQLEKELTQKQAQLVERQRSFVQLLTGVSQEALEEAPPQEDVSFFESLEEIFQPLVSKLRDITERSREIDRVSSLIKDRQEREEKVLQALEHIEGVRQQAEAGALRETIDITEKTLRKRLEDLQRDRLVAEERLKDMAHADGDLVSAVSEFLEELVGVHLRNLVTTILVIIASYFLLRFAHLRLSRTRRAKRLIEQKHWARIINVLVRTAALVVSLSLGLVVLYLSNDWILIGLFMLMLVGVLWSMKDNIPLHMAEGQLLFNVGAVREGERLVLHGLPWRVEQINYYTRLRNPALEGGVLRVRLRDLTTMTSRTYSPNEPWFPTAKRDWTLLADGVFGQVVLQSPEQVTLRIMESSTKTYPVQDFLAQKPLNLSRGYGLYLHFGVDYAHQAEVTAAIPDTLRAAIERRFAEEGLQNLLQALLVEFAEAGASSLDLAVYARFAPEAADRYYKMRRLLQRAAVDACTTNGWTIPFTQVTVHHADDTPSDRA